MSLHQRLLDDEGLDGWRAAKVRCRHCARTWSAVFPVEADELALECPACHLQESEVVEDYPPTEEEGVATDWGTIEPPSPNAVDHFSQVEAALRAHHDAQPDVTVTLDLIPDPARMNQEQAAAALRLAYTALKESEDYTVDYDPDYLGIHETCPSCPASKGRAHADTCILAAALAAIRALLPDVGGEE